MQHEELFQEGPADFLHLIRDRLIGDGVDIIDCAMINPDLAPPRVLLDKLLEAVVKPRNHRYPVARGVRKLREAFAFKYETAFNVKLDPEREICVTLGAKDAILQALRVALARTQPRKRGAAGRKPRVLLAQPYYPVHRSAVILAGGEPVTFELSDGRGQASTSEEKTLAAIEQGVAEYHPHAIVVNFPNNPLGIGVSPAFYDRLAMLLADSETLVINDFVYGELDYRNGCAPSMLQCQALRERALEVYSLSKSFSVPGWRVGCLAGPEAIVQQVANLKSHSDYGLFLPFQYAAAYALQAGDALVAPQRQAYLERATVLAGGLRRRGWSVRDIDAGAALWAFPPDEFASLGSLAFSRLLLERLGVMTGPGETFGAQECVVRLGLASPPERLRELLTRLEGLEVTNEAPLAIAAR